MNKIFEIIDSYEESDFEYYCELFSMLQMLNNADFDEFGKLLENAEMEDKKLKIDIDNDVYWDSLLLKNINFAE